jgi:tetratricopeptide (TPR) repeat protein
VTHQVFLEAQQKGLAGNHYFAQQDYAKAIEAYQEALDLYPNYPEIYFNLGLTYQQLHQLQIALQKFDQAITLKGNYYEAYIQRGNVLRDLQLHSLAKNSYENALKIQPMALQALNNLGVVHYELRQITAAIDCFLQVIEIDPDHTNAHVCLSFCWLITGQFQRGWQEFEWRLKDAEFVQKTFPLEFTQYLWRKGDKIAGKTILLMAEQGLGDAIQFCRWTKVLQDMGARVVLQVPQVLVKLLSTLEGVYQVISDHESAQNIDLVLPLMSLPHHLDFQEKDFRCHTPYLSPAPTASVKLKVPKENEKYLKVGLVWQGGRRETLPSSWATHYRRNIPLEMFTQLANPQILFYSLQKGEHALQELQQLREHSSFNIYENQIDDFTDTANIIRQLDVVITVDTAVAHLAGALGKPVWILNRFDACWRWLINRTDTPWYSSAKLYFQKSPGDWQGVIDEVKTDLLEFISERR